MSILLKEDQHLHNKLEQFIKAFEEEPLPDRVKLWISEVDAFGYVFAQATVSAKIMELNIAVDLLHEPVCLLELETPEAIKEKVRELADMVRYKYGLIFTSPETAIVY